MENAEKTDRELGVRRRSAGLGAAAVTVLLLGFAFIGRGAVSIDAGIVLSDTFGFLLTGRFEAPPPQVAPRLLPSGAVETPSIHSQFGLFPSVLLLAFVGPVWPIRELLGVRGLDAATALAWSAGAALAAWGFLRLARVLRPGVSPYWAPAFLAGTFLWPYAADSFFEPWTAGLLALGASQALATGKSPAKTGLVAGALWAAASLLKPITWITAPLLLLAAALRERSEGRQVRGLTLGVILGLGGGAALFAVTNFARTGSPIDVGYGPQSSLFTGSLWEAIPGLTVLPGRGILFYAPVVLAALFAARRLPAPAAVLCLGTPLVLLLVVGRWLGWDGGSAWGPRHILTILPLLTAPATLAPRKLAGSLLGIGMLLNLPGVLVAPGAWITVVEGLRAHQGSNWHQKGPERVSTIASLTPLWGQIWLLATGDGRNRIPPPWEGTGATASVSVPWTNSVSPLWLRAAMKLPSVQPMTGWLLLRTAQGWAARGHLDLARKYAFEAVRLDPPDRQARAMKDALLKEGPP